MSWARTCLNFYRLPEDKIKCTLMEVSATPLFSMFISKTCKQMIWPPPSSPGIFSFLELNMATVNVSFNRSGLARIKTKQQPQLKKKTVNRYTDLKQST